MWDWRTGYNFQRIHAAVQPGSLDSESGIFACMFDNSESRLITAEADKTIKVYKEDDTAVSRALASEAGVGLNAEPLTNPAFFPADGRKPPSQLEARNSQEKKILTPFLLLLLSVPLLSVAVLFFTKLPPCGHANQVGRTSSQPVWLRQMQPHLKVKFCYPVFFLITLRTICSLHCTTLAPRSGRFEPPGSSRSVCS